METDLCQDGRTLCRNCLLYTSIAVEIDTNLIPILKDTLQDCENVTVINEDILKIDIKKMAEEKGGGRPVKVVANLPYYITTPIIMGLFESGAPIDNITVMVQKEVADRMQVGPGSKDYGALSLAVQYYAEPYIVANVPPNCFIPVSYTHLPLKWSDVLLCRTPFLHRLSPQPHLSGRQMFPSAGCFPGG